MQRIRLSACLDVRNVSSDSSPAFLTIGAVREDLVGRALDRRSIDIGVSPRIVGNNAALQVWTVPLLSIARPLHERNKAVAGPRIAAHIEIKKIEGARKTLDLDFRRINFGFPQIVQHA